MARVTAVRALRHIVPIALLAAGLLVACGPGVPAPTATDDAYASPHDAVLAVPAPGLLANDVANGGAVVAGVRATTGGGSASVFADGSFTYTPAAAYAGVDGFSYSVTNAGGTATANVAIEVPAAPWVALPPLPSATSRPAGAVVDGVVYVFGGEATGGVRDGRTFAIARGAAAWDELDPMPVGLSNVCAGAIGTDVYVPGGYTGAGSSDAMLVLDTLTGTWSTVASDPVPTAVHAATCAVHGGRLYVFGGDPNGAASTAAWRYDPAAAPGTRWSTTLAPMPTATAYAAAVTVGDTIFVIGGTTADLATVQVYGTAANAWSTYPDLATGRGGPGAWVSGPYVYAGGGGWFSYLTSVERYDTRDGPFGTWQAAAPLTTGRRTFAYATDPDEGWFYAIAGWSAGYTDVAEEGLLRALVP